jgi:adenylyl-sulfate kinase
MDAAGATIWFTGLPAAGKSTLARAVANRLSEDGRATKILDGDELRRSVSRDLGFSEADRAENVRRVAHLARQSAEMGTTALVAIISPYRAGRRYARLLHEGVGLPFVEVFMSAPLDECVRRDPKGLYARARAGQIKDLTGVSAPYERPECPDLNVGPRLAVDEAAELVLQTIAKA